MKITLSFFLFLAFAVQIFAQQGKYSFFASEKNKTIDLNVKGTYLGAGVLEGRSYYEIYLEKVDALNHRYKVVEKKGSKYEKFDGMDIFLINEAALAINDLKVQNNTGKAKAQLPFFVQLRNLKEDEWIQNRIYLASKGDFSKNDMGIEQYGRKEKVDVYFPTKAQAEAFIKDLRDYLK
jgi:hypothetical protein